MTHEVRLEIRQKALALFREHCSNVVIVSAWMHDDGSLDDDVMVDSSGSLHGCIGLMAVAEDRLDELMADRYESGKEDE